MKSKNWKKCVHLTSLFNYSAYFVKNFLSIISFMYDIYIQISIRKTIYHNNKLSMTFSVWKLKTFSPYEVMLYIIVKRKCGRKGKKLFFCDFYFFFERYLMRELYPTHIHYTHIDFFFCILFFLTPRHFFSSVYILTRRAKEEKKKYEVCVYILKSTCISQIKRANELLWFICIFTIRFFLFFFYFQWHFMSLKNRLNVP